MAAAGAAAARPTPAEIASAGLVFVGNGYVINKTKTNPYQGIDVRGKVMVVAGLPAELAAAAGSGWRRGGAGAAAAGAAAAPNPLGVENTDFSRPRPTPRRTARSGSS